MLLYIYFFRKCRDVFRLTLQVTDVLRLRTRALRSKDQQPQNVVERNRTKGASPTAVLRNPSRRKAAKRLPYVKRRTCVSNAFQLLLVYQMVLSQLYHHVYYALVY